MNMWKRFAGGVAFSAMAAAIVQPASAQQTTSSVRGGVATTDGAPIADATVTITHTPTGQVVETKTNAAGVFDARGLRVGGPYTVSVTAPTYGVQAAQDLYFSLGDPLRLDFALEKADVVVVSGRNVVAVSGANVGSSTTLGQEEIGTVVTTRRDIRDLTRRDPLVTLDNVTRGTGPTGGIYIAGSTPRLNRFTIDGVKSADDFGLNTGGMSTTRGPVSIEAIEQLTVQAVPFDAAEGDFTGGAVNLVLKGGTNTFHGSAFMNFQEQDWVGQRVNSAASPVTVELENYGGFLSGPLWQDRAFFAASYEYYDSLDPNAFNGPADLGYPAGVQINGLQGSAGPRLTTADLAAVQAAYNTYGVASAQQIGGFPRVTPTTDIKNSLRLDFNLTDSQRLQAIYRHAESSLFKTSGSATAVSPISNWYIQGELEDNYALQLNSNWTDDLSTEARVAYRSYIRNQEPPQGQQFSLTEVCLEASSSGDPYQCTNTNGDNRSPTNRTPLGLPVFGVGPDQFRQANILKTKNLSTHFTASYTYDTHLLKAGVQTKSIDIFNLFVPQARGYYYFDSVADFQAGRAGRLRYQNNPSGDPNAAAADFAYNQNAIFVQDTWDVLDNVTLNAGLRYDFYTSDDSPARNAGFVSRYGFDNTATYDGRGVIMPRLSIKFEPLDDLEISAGAGLFSGGAPDVFLSNSYSNTGVLFYGLDLQRLGDGTFRDGISNAVISPAVAEQLLTINKSSYGRNVPTVANSLLNPNTLSARTAEVAAIDPDFEIPSDWKANITLRYNFFDWLLGADFVGSKTNEALAFRDLRARPLTVNGVQQYTPDGRLRYDGLNIAAAARTTAGLPVAANPDFVNLGTARDILAYNPDNEASWTRTVAVSAYKSFDDLGLDFSVAYVNGAAESYGALSEFATTPSGFYVEQFSALDPNTSVSGIATNRIEHQFKATVGWEHEFFTDFVSRITLFAETRTGRPFSFTMSDATSGRGPVFGVNRSDQLLYVPDLSRASAANGLMFTSAAVNPTTGRPVTVFFDSAATLNGFSRVVSQFGLPQGIVPKGYGQNPDVNQIDLQLAQEVPMPFLDGHKLTFTMDIKNLLNFLNNDWGVVEEYTGSRGGFGDRVVSVQCANAVTGAALTNATASCDAYRYSSFNTGPGSPGSSTPTVDTSSRWYMQLGLRYSF
jgi:outer membrane receptor protein involved in Fe transport